MVDTLLAIALSVMLTRLKAKWWGICVLSAVLGGGRVYFPVVTRALVDRHRRRNPRAGLVLPGVGAENAGENEIVEVSAAGSGGGPQAGRNAAGGHRNPIMRLLDWIPLGLFMGRVG